MTLNVSMSRAASLRAFVLGSLVLLVGCAPQGGQPIPRLIEIARPAPGTPESVSASKFDECAGKISELKGKTAVYDPAMTYNIARQLPITLDKNNPIQESIRAYSYQYEDQFMFQKRNSKLVCVYQLKEGNLRYLTVFVYISGQGVIRQQFKENLEIIYSKITGETLN